MRLLKSALKRIPLFESIYGGALNSSLLVRWVSFVSGVALMLSYTWMTRPYWSMYGGGWFVGLVVMFFGWYVTLCVLLSCFERAD